MRIGAVEIVKESLFRFELGEVVIGVFGEIRVYRCLEFAVEVIEYSSLDGFVRRLHAFDRVYRAISH